MTSLRPSVRVARGATYILIQGVVSILMDVVFLLFLVKIPQTRLPPPPNPEMGIYFILGFLVTLIQTVGTFAFQSASAKYISQYAAQGNLEKARSLVNRVLQIMLLASLISSVSLLIFAEQISWILTGSSECIALFRILAVACFLEMVISQLYLFPIYIIVGAIVYFLSLFALKAIKKRDLDLVYEYLPGRFKRITVWIERLASLE